MKNKLRMKKTLINLKKILLLKLKILQQLKSTLKLTMKKPKVRRRFQASHQLLRSLTLLQQPRKDLEANHLLDRNPVLLTNHFMRYQQSLKNSYRTLTTNIGVTLTCTIQHFGLEFTDSTL